jgi:hypothetical protein
MERKCLDSYLGMFLDIGPGESRRYRFRLNFNVCLSLNTHARNMRTGISTTTAVTGVKDPL